MAELVIDKKDSTAWDYALGMIKVDGLEPSADMLEMIEMEKRGEITTSDIIERLKEKYRTWKDG